MSKANEHAAMTSSPALNQKLASGPLPEQALEFYRHLEQWDDAHTRGVALLSRFCAAAAATHGVEPMGNPRVEPLPPYLAALVPPECLEEAAAREAAASWQAAEDSHGALRGVMEALEENALGMAVAAEQARAAAQQASEQGGAGVDHGEQELLARMKEVMRSRENEMQLKSAIVDSLWPALEPRAHSCAAMQNLLAKYCAAWETLPYCTGANRTPQGSGIETT